MEVSSRIEQIKIALAKQNLKYKDLSLMSNIPFSTILKVLSGNTKNPRIDTMEAIERALGLRSETQHVVGTPPVPLSEAEKKLIMLYRLIPAEGKDAVARLINSYLS